MKNVIAALSLALLLTGCVMPENMTALPPAPSPLETMTPAERMALSDNQVCDFIAQYASGPQTARERDRRKLNCNPDFRYCVNNGFHPGTSNFLGCLTMYKKNQIESEQASAQAEQARAEAGKASAQEEKIRAEQQRINDAERAARNAIEEDKRVCKKVVRFALAAGRQEDYTACVRKRQSDRAPTLRSTCTTNGGTVDCTVIGQ